MLRWLFGAGQHQQSTYDAGGRCEVRIRCFSSFSRTTKCMDAGHIEIVTGAQVVIEYATDTATYLLHFGRTTKVLFYIHSHSYFLCGDSTPSAYAAISSASIRTSSVRKDLNVVIRMLRKPFCHAAEQHRMKSNEQRLNSN